MSKFTHNSDIKINEFGEVCILQDGEEIHKTEIFFNFTGDLDLIAAKLNEITDVNKTVEIYKVKSDLEDSYVFGKIRNNAASRIRK